MHGGSANSAVAVVPGSGTLGMTVTGQTLPETSPANVAT